MGYLKEKSEFNIDSAKELINLSYYAPSVHCSYYGSFQFMKYALRRSQNVTYEEIENECKSYSGGTHGYVIHNILSELRKKITNTSDYTNIKRIVNDLKTFRIKSDYFNLQILADDAEKSLKFSQEIINTIKTNL